MSNLQVNDLSERELDILKLVATGASNKEIAQILFISSNTVKVHLRNIFTKINATSRTEAAMYAVRIGLVENASPQIPVIEEGLGSPNNVEITSVGTLAIPVKEKSRFSKVWQVIGGIAASIAILTIIFVGSIYLRQNITQRNTPIPPTATPRVQWFELTGLPTPRQGLATVGYENMVYAIGGEYASETSNIVEKYDPEMNTWVTLSPKPTPVTDANAAVIGDLIYVPGGRLASGEPTKTTEIYNPDLNRWELGKPLPKALSAYSLAVYEGKMYIFGGWDGKKETSTVYVFDPHDSTWTELAPLPSARSYTGAAVIGSKIYIVGGWDGTQALSDCLIFRPTASDKAKQWTNAVSMPYGRYGMGVSNLADMVFVMGGTDVPGDPAIIVLLQGEKAWNKLDSPVQSGWYNLGTVSIGSRLYAFGGKTSTGLITDMWSYQAIYTITLPIVR